VGGGGGGELTIKINNQNHALQMLLLALEESTLMKDFAEIYRFRQMMQGGERLKK
jgi:hypothetical protein